MTLLHIGIFNKTEAQQSLRDALKSICDKYVEYNYDDYMAINEIMLKTPCSVVFMQIQRENVIKVDTVRKMRERGARIFNFTGDVRQPVPKWYEELAPYVTTLFTNLTDAEYFQSKGFDAEYFQIGYNEHFYSTKAQPSPDAPRIVFMGNDYKEMFPLSGFRREMVERLQKKYKTDFKVYGNGWKTESLNTNQKKEGEVYRGCEIAINLSHFDLKRYSSDRLFRILGSGAFCLSHKYQEIEQEFTDGVHLVTWENLDELEEKIDHYLKPENEAERTRIAQAGNRLCELHFTWTARMVQLKSLI